MLRTFNTTVMAFLLALEVAMLIVLLTPISLHNRLLLTVASVVIIWLGIALWVTQKNNMKRVFVYQLGTLVVFSGLIGLRLFYA